MRPIFDLLFSGEGTPLPERASLLPLTPPEIRECFTEEEWRQVTALLSENASTQSDALYRQEIFKDLLKYPELADRICKAGELEPLAAAAAREGVDAAESPEAAFEALKATVISLMEHLKYLRQLRTLFREEEITAPGLLKLREQLEQVANAPVFGELSREAAGYPLLSPDSLQAEIRLCTGPRGEIREVELKSLQNGGRAARRGLFSDSGETQRPTLKGAELTVEALCRLNRKFRALTEAIRSAAAGLKGAADFYRGGLRLAREAGSRGLPICFAIPTQTQVSALRVTDPACLKGAPLRQWDIRPRPLQVFAGVKGKDDLHTVAALLCLGAAGLPLPAKRVEMPFASGVFACTAPDRPRPEEEIPALSRLYYGTEPGRTVLIDTPLRSLAETDAAEILRGMLHGFFRRSVSVFCATDLSLT